MIRQADKQRDRQTDDGSVAFRAADEGRKRIESKEGREEKGRKEEERRAGGKEEKSRRKEKKGMEEKKR